MPASGDRHATRRLLLTVGIAVVAFVGVALAATSGPVPLAVEGSGGWVLGRLDGDLPDLSETERSDRIEQLDQTDSRGSAIVDVLLQIALILVVAALLVVVGRAVVRAVRLAAESRRPPPPPAEFAPPTGSRELSEAVDEGLAVLAAGPVDDVIIACWVRLEDAAAAGGAGRRPSETPAELAVRVLASFQVPDTAVEQLLDLYRAARYSRHPLGEADRAAAIAALAEIGRTIGLVRT